MEAIVVGATGAVGRDLVQALLHDDRYTKVTAFVRREMHVSDDKLRVHVVDLERPEGWRDLLRGDVLFCALGTSRKQAGSKAAQYHVDYELVMDFARIARGNGVPDMIFVSSVGANETSAAFYLRTKGEVERDLSALGFDSLVLLQPPFLIRHPTKRLLETMGVKVFQALAALGILTGMKPISTMTVARAMANLAVEHRPGVTRLMRAGIAEAGGEA